MNTAQSMSDIAEQLRKHDIKVYVLSEYYIARFVGLRPNEIRPTKFEPPLTTIATNAEDKVSALVTIILVRVRDMLNALKGFQDAHDYEAFVVLNALDMFGKDEILRLAYQAAVIQKKSVVDIVTDDSYGSLQGLHDSTTHRE